MVMIPVSLMAFCAGGECDMYSDSITAVQDDSLLKRQFSRSVLGWLVVLLVFVLRCLWCFDSV